VQAVTETIDPQAGPQDFTSPRSAVSGTFV
jgi:hypothetical protein